MNVTVIIVHSPVTSSGTLALYNAIKHNSSAINSAFKKIIMVSFD